MPYDPAEQTIDWSKCGSQVKSEIVLFGLNYYLKCRIHDTAFYSGLSFHTEAEARKFAIDNCFEIVDKV